MTDLEECRKRKAGDAPNEEPSAVRPSNGQSQTARLGLQDLPLELLYTILLESASTSLPITSKHFWTILSQASDSVKFHYLVNLWHAWQLSNAASLGDKPKKKRHAYGLKHFREHDENREVRIDHEDFAIDPVLPSCYGWSYTSGYEREPDVDVFTFVSSFAICTRAILRRVSGCVLQHETVCTVGRCRHRSYRLPKRLFQTLRTPVFDKRILRASPLPYFATQESFVSSEDRTRFSSESHAFLQKLALDKDSAADMDLDKRIGPLPSPEHCDMLLELLRTHNKNPTAHNGYALVIAVHHRAYALINLLMMYGADPNHKQRLALRIAISENDLPTLKLLSRKQHTSEGLFANPAYTVVYPGAQYIQANLRLAIQKQHWDIVDYLYLDQKIVPDWECLRLMEKLRFQ